MEPETRSPATSSVDLLEGREPVNASSAAGRAEAHRRLRQRALAAKPAARVESLDFDLHESYVTMRKEQTRTRTGNKMRALRRWLLIAVIGGLVGLVGVGVSYVSRNLSNLRLGIFLRLFEEERSGQLPEGSAVLALAGISAAYVLLAAWMVAYVEPAGAGSGIPEVKCLLNGIELPRMMTLQTLIVKVLGMTLSTTSGLAVGREGPMVHAGAMVAANAARGFSVGCARYDEFGSDVEVRGAVSCGVASGLAAAFNAPVGGLLLVIEEGVSYWSAQLTWRVVFTAMLAAYLVAVLQSTILISGSEGGKFGSLSNPGLFSFGTFSNSQNSYGIYDLPFFLAVGALGGVFGIAFNALASRVALWRSRFVGGPRSPCCCARPKVPAWYLRPFCWVGWCPAAADDDELMGSAASSSHPASGAAGGAASGAAASPARPAVSMFTCAGTPESSVPFKKLSDAVLVTIVISLVEFGICHQWGDCLESPSLRLKNTNQKPATPELYLEGLVRFNCPPGHYNDLATFFFNPSDAIIHLLFHFADGPLMSSAKLLLCFAVYTLVMLAGYGVAVPAGLLVPPLVAGAALGRAIGQGFRVSGWPLAALGTYSLIGAASLLGGITRSTVFLAVMLMECTSTVVFALPLILALTAARYTGNLVNHGLFEMHIEMKGYPYLEEKPRQAQAAKLTAADVMVPYSRLVCLGEVEVVGRVLEVLDSNNHHAFPVLFDRRRRDTPGSRIGSFAGLVYRRDLLGLLLLRKLYRTAPHIERRTSSAANEDAMIRRVQGTTGGGASGRAAGEHVAYAAPQALLSSGPSSGSVNSSGEGSDSSDSSTPSPVPPPQPPSSSSPPPPAEAEDWTQARLGVIPAAQSEEDMLGGEPLPEGRSVFGTLDISTPTRGGGRGAMAAARPTVMSSMLSTRMLGSAADRRGSEPLLANRQPVVGFDFTGEPLATDDDIRNSGADRATALARVRALLSEDDLQCVLDLRPFLNATPFTVHVHAPLARVYRLFRGLGLRHLVCVDDAHDVVGIITRSSLTEPSIHKVYHDKFPSSSSRGHSSSS